MAKTTFFGSEAQGEAAGFDFSREYPFQETLLDSNEGRLSKVSDNQHVWQLTHMLTLTDCNMCLDSI